MPGTKGHEFEDMKAFADWRADYVKIDWCNTTGQDPAQAYSSPLPPIIVADSYRAVFRASAHAPQELAQKITVRNNGSSILPLWKVRPGLPSWLSVTLSQNGNAQKFSNKLSTAGLTKGHYHAVVRADNREALSSGLPMSALYHDVDLELD